LKSLYTEDQQSNLIIIGTFLTKEISNFFNAHANALLAFCTDGGDFLFNDVFANFVHSNHLPPSSIVTSILFSTVYFAYYFFCLFSRRLKVVHLV